MNIPVSQFAKKIEQHVAEIKQLSENSPKLREHVSAIQALCEIMMEAGNDPVVKEWVPSHPIQKPASMVTSPSAQKSSKSMMDYDMEYEDDDSNDSESDGNNDSIFDF
ncbi:YwdI family protein [Fictibacillus nanhaiensis]|uniref:DUF5327 family protein n=1 Tax=Fictibacillus nanhaiensis TaxID=742169 RepID=UPI001C986A45|nr:DUF5327 family protein [Fictibacillus nanhaiensis]MBY6037426.1 YwdI family protein [Fictibacillus nanhaiensis]